ncbi:hypothetical protein DBR47_14555 [Paucibacter sp. KBW04]|uniref:DUF4224 domain-containing protein n=1 Tax=Paucibacter sp. KBW04 TaxID=2153361 RepID=UPI000F5695EA|nr:DUF4224 domain-containing protein [Paucibacter sp. KBW04]RQO58009.1 hypothetical protein DBR47_14555 [Paucibacter sp. KBW04]
MIESAEFLTPDEVKTLTDSRNVEQQERVLSQDGIPYKRRGRRILVSRHHTREWLAGRVVTPSRAINLALVK